MKIILTNWINILGVFIAVYLYALILNIMDGNVSKNIYQAVFATLFVVVGYGLMFWGIFIMALIILDSVLLRSKDNLKMKLIIEWLIISSPFIYWTVKYHEWIFVVAIIAFLIAQLHREKKISVVIQ
jgi:hypothetical protein